nr:ferric reduction oxidase 2-like [Ipomoea batatas]
MFVALFIWSFSSYLHNAFRYITPQYAAEMGVKLWEAKLEGTGLRFGLVGNIFLTFLFYPVCRGSSILRLVGLTSEGSIKYHIWLGHTAMLLFTAHGLCYVILWVSTHQIAEMVNWSKVGISNLAGEIALAAGLIMWSTTSSRIRRKAFELFFYTHYLYIVFVVFFVFHVGFGYFCIMLPGFYLFLVDRFLRFLQSQQRIGVVSARVLPCHTVELNFSKTPSLRYSPTSSVFVNMPGISKLQWHPFTVTSSSEMDCDTLSVVIKSAGSWSQRLYQNLSSPLPKQHRLEAGLEGPYGPPAASISRFLGHERLVMVCGGSGITPFISIIRELIHIAGTSSTRRLPKLLLVAAFKNSVDLTMLDLVLPLSGTPHDVSRLGLRIEAYVTRDEGPAKDQEQKSVHTIWFEPDPADKPVSAVLGPNSWLYLGAVISSSFVIFLLIIGILTRYYIYPIDPAINGKFNNSSESALYMLFLCIAIAMAATAGFVWNKKQIQNTNTPSVHNGDRELESLPHQSLAQVTTTHYGERPNLKNILMMECKGADVGVFVSGPSGLRQEVAKICSSSGVSDNLHFESFSFTW